ncbi:hypothetical protein JHK82_048494 [Glycine max]|nr:hypothetical protein JHK82_048494 [Glycine max]
MVAVDKDKNSGYAFRWTIKHIDNPVIIAVHVKHKNIPHHEGTNVFPPDEDDIAHVFKPLRHMCHGNIVMLKEAVIDDSDVVKGIVEYAQRNRVNTIVVGATHSCKSTLARTLNLRSGSKRGSTNGRSERSTLLEMPRCSSAGQSTNQRSLFSPSSVESDSPSDSLGDLEAAMKMLRLKLKQTMDMYSSAQNKAKEINQWKEERISEEATKLPKEAALEPVEMEKVKAQAALEAAEEAIKMVEKEAQKRFQLEVKARREAQEKDRTLNRLINNDTRYRKYSIKDIEEATQKFSPSLKVGEGGYGPVFRGQLDHTPVAIKILNPEASHGRRQFQQEVEILCSIRHPNMVLLLGACPEYGCLVYEYLENGSLEDRLLMKNNSPPIPWWKRFEIAAEIATALLFLHQTKPEPIVHRDLKPSNILLDKNFVSKISDVGLARLVPPSVADSVTQYHLTAAAGTFCYIDPEYQQTGRLTKKSDIYSLGIMLLQIITAKPPMGLAHHVKRAIEKETFSEMLDIMISDVPLEEALAFAKLSLSCAELSKKDRPDLATVVVPELNRLRDFGLTFQKNQNRSHPPHSLTHEVGD